MTVPSYPLSPVGSTTAGIDITGVGPFTFPLDLDSGQPIFWPADGSVLIQSQDDPTIFGWGQVSSFDSATNTLIWTKKYVPSTIASQTLTSFYVTLIDGAPQLNTFFNPTGLEVVVSTADVSHDVKVKAGSIVDSTGTVTLNLTSALIKQIDAVFAAGTNQGGMVAAVPITGTVDATASTTITGTGTNFLTVFGTGTPPSIQTDFAAQQAAKPNNFAFGPNYASAITINGTVYKVTAVASDTSLTVDSAVTCAGATASIGGYATASLVVPSFVVIARKDSTGVCDICFTPATGSGQPLLPSGYTFYRVLALFLINNGTIFRGSFSYFLQPLRPYTNPGLPCGRLTIDAVVPVATVVNAVYVAYWPYIGNNVPLFDGNMWVPTTMSAIVSQFLSDTTKSPAAAVPCGLYNMYMWDDAGTIRLSRGPLLPRTNATITVTIATPAVVTYNAHNLQPGTPVIFTTTGALPTGITAGTVYYVIATGIAANTFRFSATKNGAAVNTSGTQSGVHTCTIGWTGTPSSEISSLLSYSNFVYTNASDITNGPVANFGLFVGTIATSPTGLLDWQFGAAAAGGTEAFFSVWNYYNRVDVNTFIGDTANTWTYATTSWRPADNSYTMRASFVCGIAEEPFNAEYYSGCTPDGTSYCAVGYDITTGTPANGLVSRYAAQGQQVAHAGAVPVSGFHYAQAVEMGNTTGTGTTFYGDQGQTFQVAGLAFSWRM